MGGENYCVYFVSNFNLWVFNSLTGLNMYVCFKIYICVCVIGESHVYPIMLDPCILEHVKQLLQSIQLTFNNMLTLPAVSAGLRVAPLRPFLGKKFV